jgi:hypothetical protein
MSYASTDARVTFISESELESRFGGYQGPLSFYRGFQSSIRHTGLHSHDGVILSCRSFMLPTMSLLNVRFSTAHWNMAGKPIPLLPRHINEIEALIQYNARGSYFATDNLESEAPRRISSRTSLYWFYLFPEPYETSWRFSSACLT